MVGSGFDEIFAPGHLGQFFDGDSPNTHWCCSKARRSKDLKLEVPETPIDSNELSYFFCG